MSYEQPIPTMPQPLPAAAPTGGRRRGGRAALGLGLIVLGLVAGGGAWLGQQRTYENRVTSLERAVSGYSTELKFEKAGTFTLYYEYEGAVTASVDGDDRNHILNADSDPQNFDLSLTDSDGDDVRLTRLDAEIEYSVNGHSGVAYRQVVIGDSGDYQLAVVPEDPDKTFALAIGIGTAEKPSALIPISLALAGLLGGLALLVLDRGAKPSAQVASGAPSADVWSQGSFSGYGSAPGAPVMPPVVPPPPPAPGVPAAPPTMPVPSPPTAPSGQPPAGPPPPAPPSSFPPPIWQPPGS